MTCAIRQETLALYARGDCDPDLEERLDLEAHLAACDRCRTELRALRETCEDLGRLAAEPIPPEAFESVRTAVLIELGSTSRPWWLSGLAAAAMVLAGLTALWLFLRPVPVEETKALVTREREEVPATTPTPAHEPDPDPGPDRAFVHERRDRRYQEALTATSSESPRAENGSDRVPASDVTVLKLLTDDPDIVILWLVD